MTLTHHSRREIELGEDFFNEIIRCPIPIDLNTLRAMKRSPLGLDLYLWLTYRTFALKRPLRLTWRQLYRQFGADQAKASKVAQQAFRRDYLRELKENQERLAGPALPDGQGGAAALPLAAGDRAVTIAARGIVLRLLLERCTMTAAEAKKIAGFRHSMRPELIL